MQSSPTKTYPQTSARFPSIIDQDTTLSMSSSCRGKDDYNGEEISRSELVLSSLLTLRHNQLHSDGVPPSCVSRPGCNQALLSTSFQSESHPVPRGPTDPAGPSPRTQRTNRRRDRRSWSPLLARDELDGWPGLRPYVGDVLAKCFAPATVPRSPVRTSRSWKQSWNQRLRMYQITALGEFLLASTTG